jgi:hypothetical protein
MEKWLELYEERIVTVEINVKIWKCYFIKPTVTIQS